MLRNFVLRDEDFVNGVWDTGATTHYSPSYTGRWIDDYSVMHLFNPWEYSGTPNPMPPVMNLPNSRWIYSREEDATANAELGITPNNFSRSYSMAANLRNFFGLRYTSIKLGMRNRTPSQYPLLIPGTTLQLSQTDYNSVSFYASEVEDPSLETTGYYFADLFTYAWENEAQRDIMPGSPLFQVAGLPPVLVASVGVSFPIAGWAKQRIVNGDQTKFAYLGQYFDKAYKADPVTGQATTTETGILSEYGEFFPTEPGLTILKTKYDADQAASPGGPQGEAKVHVLKIQLDVNHDGNMDLTYAGPDNTSPERPFVFWLNNDVDRSHFVDCDWLCQNCDSEEDDVQLEDVAYLGPERAVLDFDFKELNPLTAQYDLPMIPSRRDLEDYARLWIPGLSRLISAMPAGYGVQLLLLGDAEVNVVQAAETDGGTGYLTDETIAEDQRARSKNLFVGRLTATSPIFLGSRPELGEHFIFCGAKRGTAQLILRVTDTSANVIAESSAYIQIKDIKEMYERYTVGDTAKGPISPLADLASEDLPPGPRFSYSYDAARDATTPYILFVHGWNMERWEKDRFSETSYKRLYWQGYQGRFGSFRWPTDSGFGGRCELQGGVDFLLRSRHYDSSEFTAWKSAESLRHLLIKLKNRHPDRVYLLAHSMGNIVAGEALRLAGNVPLVNTYVASEASVPAHAYDQTIADAGRLLSFTYDHPNVPGPAVTYGEDTPNIYGNWFAGNSGAAGRRVSFYNPNDWALAPDIWQFNQILKPDNSPFDWLYGFDGFPNNLQQHYTKGSPDDDPPWDHFFKGTSSGVTPLPIAQNRYEIMAFVAEARSKALGATPSVAGLTDNVNLARAENRIWPPDLENPTEPYSAHKWHSAPFRSTNMKQQGYWRTLLRAEGFRLQ